MDASSSLVRMASSTTASDATDLRGREARTGSIRSVDDSAIARVLINRALLRPLMVGFQELGSYRRGKHDLCGFPVSKAAAASPRPRNGVCGGGRRRPHCTVARQSHLVVSLAQRVAALAVIRPLYCARPDRDGRLRQ